MGPYVCVSRTLVYCFLSIPGLYWIQNIQKLAPILYYKYIDVPSFKTYRYCKHNNIVSVRDFWTPTHLLKIQIIVGFEETETPRNVGKTYSMK